MSRTQFLQVWELHRFLTTVGKSHYGKYQMLKWVIICMENRCGKYLIKA